MVRMDGWRLGLMGMCLLSAAGVVQADSLDQQRQRYLQIKQAWDSNQMDTVAQLMPTLRDYPLYPYLEYRQLTDDLGQISSAQISEFIAAHPTLPPVRSLPARFVNELARRQDWYSLLAFSPNAPEPAAARCNYYYAKWATGQQQVAWDGAAEIWLSGKSLPASCDKLLTAWQQAGKQTPSATLARIGLALKENNASLVSYLVKQLPADYQTMATALAQLQSNPASVERFARSVEPTDFTRQVTTTAFTRLARQDIENARAMLPTVVRLQKMSNEAKLALEEMVALRLMGNDATPAQAAWRDEVTLRSRSTPLIERRIRMALGSGDRQGLAIWLARLSSEDNAKEEWRYWQASLLLEQGKKAEGEAILQALMQARGFYPMVAAQKLNKPYPVRVEPAVKPDPALAQRPEISRVRELMYWQMDNQARSEWSYLVASRSKAEQEALARYAFEQRWADLSVQATIVAKLWDHLEERFPLAWPQEFQRATEGKGITPSYAMAIARQESAWNPKAQSPVGASGLMQVMPRTAEHTVKLNNIQGYVNSSQLLDPQTNIIIGTSYLEEVYQKFGRNRILASAAYNAGPSRVNTWLGNSAGQVDAIAFIESIPFNETRGYVKNVLAYDAFYRHFMQRPTKVLSDAEWERRY